MTKATTNGMKPKSGHVLTIATIKCTCSILSCFNVNFFNKKLDVRMWKCPICFYIQQQEPLPIHLSLQQYHDKPDQITYCLPDIKLGCMVFIVLYIFMSY